MSPTRFRGFALAALLAASASPHAAEQRATPAAAPVATPADEARIDRLTALVAEMIPIGKIMELAAETNPKWPMQDAPEVVDAAQLACLRAALNDAGYRRWKRPEIADYVARHPERIDHQITVLDAGAARYFGRFVMVGARSRLPDGDPEAVARGGEPSTDELESVEEVVAAPEFRQIRDISGLTVLIGMADPNKKRDHEDVRSLITSYFQLALESCGVRLPDPAP